MNHNSLNICISISLQVEIPLANTIISHNASYPIFANYTGLSSQTLQNNLWSNYSQDYSSAGDPSVNFAIVFGVLFSGVTGIMAGANMSGNFINLMNIQFLLWFVKCTLYPLVIYKKGI